MLLKKISILLSATTLLLFFAAQSGCKKNDSIDNTNPGLETPITADDAVKVTATVTGTVIDENNKPVSGVAVTASNASTTTDAMGNFVFKNISISAANGFVTVIKAGYFKGIRSFVTDAGKNNYVKIQLIKQVVSGTITNATGGVVNVTGGATITFPADAFVTASGNAYTGSVSVLAHWIDPTAPNLPLVVPGDLRGINSSNGEYLLKSYGMAGAEFTDNSGNALKIAPGKTAAISFPIPPSLQATAPATIPLWHFDEATARWKEEGAATKSGNTYTGQVNKFSFWNIDVPGNFIKLDMLLKNAANNLPLANTLVKITSLTTNTSAYGHTNDSGYVSGYVPKNENLKLEVIAGTACANTAVIYTQNIGPYNSNTSLGNITVTLPASFVINFTGTINNCSNQPVTNGYLSLSLSDGTGTIAYTDANGKVNFSLVRCDNGTGYNYNAVDLSNGNYSTAVSGTVTNNTVNLGTINACGNAINTTGVYIAGRIDNRAVLWKDGNPIFLTNKFSWGIKVAGYNNSIYCLLQSSDTINNAVNYYFQIWKDSVITSIATVSQNDEVKGLDIYNGDVYACGNVNNYSPAVTAKVWKNGIATTLPKDTFSSVKCSDIKVINGDVYITGYGTIFTPGRVSTDDDIKAVYWKNGVINVLAPGSHHGDATGIFFNNGDLYITGHENNLSKLISPDEAVYWKNGIKTSLPLTGIYNSASVNSIFIYNNDVYSAGSLIQFSTTSPSNEFFRNAALWKNNSVTQLTNTSTFHDNSEIFDLVVKNNIVYAVGRKETANSTTWTRRPLYFQNGISIPLNGFTANQYVSLNSIYIK